VALLEASDVGANGFSAQSRTNKVMKRLKAEAADLGANGILLQGFETHQTGSIGTGLANTSFSGNSGYTYGTGISTATVSKVGKAIAIYVPADQSIPQPAPSAAQPSATQIAPSPDVAPSTQSATTPEAAESCIACAKIGNP